MKHGQYLVSYLSDQSLYDLGFKCPYHPNDDHLAINRPKREVETPSHSAKHVWLSYLEGKSVTMCLKEEREILFGETNLNSFAEQSLVWFGKVSQS